MKKVHFIATILLIAFSLSGCQLPSVAEWATEPGGLLFQDDFSSTEGSWTRASTPDGAMDYYREAFRVWVNLSDYDFWSTPGLNFQAVRLEVDAGRLSGPDENRYGLVCRYQDTQNFYFFVISSDGYYGIGKVIQGRRSLLGQEMMTYNPNIHLGMSPNHLRADCIGDTLAFYVNEQPVAIVQDFDFTSGDVGLLAGSFDQPGVDIIFDNFKVIKP